MSPVRAATPAGYSGTPLGQKLGIKAGHRVSLVTAPAHIRDLIKPLPVGVTFVGTAARELDIVMLFATARSALVPAFAKATARIATAGMVWVAWPKRSSGVATDLSETAVREIGLARGLVDVKVCAIDATWSGHKFVRRIKDR